MTVGLNNLHANRGQGRWNGQQGQRLLPQLLRRGRTPPQKSVNVTD